jgi:hypothetical protein
MDADILQVVFVRLLDMNFHALLPERTFVLSLPQASVKTRRVSQAFFETGPARFLSYI